MSRKAKHKHHHAPTSAADLRPRIDRAAAEGRFQQALELTKQLYRYEPTPAHKQLLLNTYLGRARQLRSSGYTRDAITVINAGLSVDGADLPWLEQAAQELAACGDAAGAQNLAIDALEVYCGWTASDVADAAAGKTVHACVPVKTAADPLKAALSNLNRILRDYKAASGGTP